MLTAAQPDLAAAEAGFVHSIEWARRQSAVGWELRAAIPLARLWFEQGRASEARAMLSGLLDQYSEGLDTADPAEAARLLQKPSLPAPVSRKARPPI